MRCALASLTLLAFVVALTAAPIPKEKPKSKDTEAIQGTWQVQKIDIGGGQPFPVDVTQMSFTFKDGKLMAKHGDQPAKEGTYKIDPEAKLKEIDLIENNRTAPGIYELDGDTLKICLSEGTDATRPTEFKPDGKRCMIVIFKRVKDEKKEK